MNTEGEEEFGIQRGSGVDGSSKEDAHSRPHREYLSLIEHESVSFVDFWGENVPARSTVGARSWPGAVSKPVLLKQSKQEREKERPQRETGGGA